MEKENVSKLIEKYNQGLCEPDDLSELEQLIEGGEVSLLELRDLATLDDSILKIRDRAPSMELDSRIHSMIKKEQVKVNRSFLSFKLTDWYIQLPRLAFASALIIVGFVAGYFLSQPSGETSVVALTQEVSDLKEMVMLSMIEKESATDRLKAVSLTNDMDKASQHVTTALIKTLNQDGNINVRLAALDALRPYVLDSDVREALVRSISIQESPLVQVALAELMVELQEKKSVGELKKLLQEDNTPIEIKERIEKSIQVLI